MVHLGPLRPGGPEIEIIEFPYQKGILYGLPVRVYHDRVEPTGHVTSFLLDILISMFGFNGAVLVYEDSYWSALWYWLWAKDLSED